MQTIGGVPRDEILVVAEEVVARFLKLPENQKPERTGGYFTILNNETGKRYFMNEIGACLSEMDADCFHFCQEKSIRLRENNKRSGHISGWESRWRDKARFGGAIMAPADSNGLEEGRDLIGSFSGINEHSEEVILAVIWMVFRWITLEDARRIMAISENLLLDPLLKVCNDLFDRQTK
ncbi:MAG: hypothetical protein ACD_8C00092G0001 [uncultured bacterium]|nr:MAG: hypothetical protein ACD_8C00092G0001 [uncultured bacterium]